MYGHQLLVGVSLPGKKNRIRSGKGKCFVLLLYVLPVNRKKVFLLSVEMTLIAIFGWPV